MINNLIFTPEQFATNYQINFSKLLGKGHDSTVFLTMDKQSKQQYALKCLAQTTEQNAINLFNEIQILRHIQHPYIIQMIGYCSDCSCMLLELMPFGSLYKVLLSGPLPLAIANGITLQIAEALSYLHSKGITHGDLKLDNLLISLDFKVKLCDFGFAKINGSTPIPKATISGSEGYTAPEIWHIPQDLKKCDMFSLGVVYFIMVTGHPPFESNNPSTEDSWWKLIKNENWSIFWKELKLTILPEYVRNIIQKLLCVNFQFRYSADEILQILIDKSATSEQITDEVKKRLNQKK
ncbi:unnamed protein product [Paramecium sonneborni]|uniref:Protein kinase domain-containing protein n=1 Tax=Paramecium sonneborni TaxID=65129 RepID=A0A8S1RBN5_9CILI|nr:unnamed protein product [Paramecium sonneborni]